MSSCIVALVTLVLLVRLVSPVETIIAKVKRFEELECWKEARNFVQPIYALAGELKGSYNGQQNRLDKFKQLN